MVGAAETLRRAAALIDHDRVVARPQPLAGLGQRIREGLVPPMLRNGVWALPEDAGLAPQVLAQLMELFYAMQSL